MWRGKSWYLVVLACVGCSGNVECNAGDADETTSGRLSASELEALLRQQLERKAVTPDAVECHTDGVTPQVGAAVICEVLLGETYYGIRWTVTASDNDGHFQGEAAWIDGHPLNMRVVEKAIARELGKNVPDAVTVDCGAPLRFVEPLTRYYCDATTAVETRRVWFHTGSDSEIDSFGVD